MKLAVVSFSFKRDLPAAEYVFDVRFLQNPHYMENLTAHSGREPGVGEYIAADPAYAAFFTQLTGMLQLVLPRFAAQERDVTIAIGCTGGRHRSVFVAEQLAGVLGKQGYAVALAHRDIDTSS